MTKLAVPEEVLSKARIHGTQTWLDALPERIASPERDWSLRRGRVSARGSTAISAP